MLLLLKPDILHQPRISADSVKDIPLMRQSRTGTCTMALTAPLGSLARAMGLEVQSFCWRNSSQRRFRRGRTVGGAVAKIHGSQRYERQTALTVRIHFSTARQGLACRQICISCQQPPAPLRGAAGTPEGKRQHCHFQQHPQWQHLKQVNRSGGNCHRTPLRCCAARCQYVDSVVEMG